MCKIIKKSVKLPNLQNTIFCYKSISIKQNKNNGKKNNGKQKHQIRDFGLVLSLSLLLLKSNVLPQIWSNCAFSIPPVTKSLGHNI